MPLRPGSRYPSTSVTLPREREPGATALIVATQLCRCYWAQLPGCSTRHCWKCHYNGHYGVELFLVNEFRPACPRHPTGCWRGCSVSYRDDYGAGNYRLATDEERRRALRADALQEGRTCARFSEAFFC